jgi:DNA modification methylase
MGYDRVVLGDCVEGLKQIESGSIDLAFADPPFNIGYDYDIYNDRRAAEDYLEWSKRWTSEIARVLKPDGSFWLAIGDEFAAELKVIVHRELGLSMRNWVVWYYTFGVNCTRKFTRSHVHLLYFVKNPSAFTFNIDDIRVPSARQLVYADKRANAKGRLPDDTWILRPQDAADSFTPIEDTWYVSRVCGTFKERDGGHGCQMPEQVLGRIVRACTNPGDVVLDPFAGSGTTLAVAKKLDRRYLGFEISPSYHERIASRLSFLSPGDPLDGNSDPFIVRRRVREKTIKT